jgi:CrcB protein
MVSVIAVAIGGAIGAVLRYLLVNSLSSFSLFVIPLGVLSCNVLGSFLLGIVFSWSIKDPLVSENLRIILQVGILGAFTTFSAFTLEVFYITEKGEYLYAILYIILSVFLSIGGLFLGINLYRILG